MTQFIMNRGGLGRGGTLMLDVRIILSNPRSDPQILFPAGHDILAVCLTGEIAGNPNENRAIGDYRTIDDVRVTNPGDSNGEPARNLASVHRRHRYEAGRHAGEGRTSCKSVMFHGQAFVHGRASGKPK
tara:strand:- start:482 stop:868 length:387 start_codon:yes stop_codon:yes gene_type:complete